MAARPIIVAMPKGGSGKTATAIAFARALASAGRRVLLVDLDPQASATAALGVPPGASAAVQLLERVGRLEAVRLSDRLHLVPSPGDGSLDAAFEKARRLRGLTAFREALRRMADGYDHVICDCGPSLGSTTLMALAAGPVLAPVETTRLTVAALPRLAAAIAALRRAGVAASVLAYLPTRHASRQTESREALEALRAVGRTRVLAAVIPQSTAVARSLAEGISLFDARYRSSRAPHAYLAALGEVVSRLEVGHE